MVLSDQEIYDLDIVAPMVPAQIKKQNWKNVISYGLSSYGYDIRCASEFKILTATDGIVDPKDIDASIFTTVENNNSGYIVIPPHSLALTKSMEYFKIPRNVVGVCVGKSTYARCGIIVNITPLEPEWEGYLTIEISNTSPLPVKVYINEGIAQCLFLRGGVTCLVSYKDRKGKYQNQEGVQLAKV